MHPGDHPKGHDVCAREAVRMGRRRHREPGRTCRVRRREQRGARLRAQALARVPSPERGTRSEVACAHSFEHTRRVEPSEEIRRVIDRLTKAMAEGDSESVLGRLSEHPGTLIIGSDPAEWWRGHETRAVWARQIEEFDGSFLVQANEIDSWEEGSVGWASVKETIDLGGKSIEGRASYILHLE